MQGRAASERSERLSSVRNAARLLKEFSHTDRQLGVSELARRLGLGTSTVHRLLATLTDEKLLERGSTPGRYQLGLAVYELGAAVSPHLDLHAAALPVMASVRHSTRQTVHIGVLDGLEVVFVERLEGLETVHVFTRVGTRLPAHSTSTGKVLLAALPPEDVERVLAEPSRSGVEPRWRPSPAEREQVLREVRARGWALTDEQLAPGIRSVAAPLRDGEGRVIAAMNVTVHAAETSVERLTQEHLPRLLHAAGAISADFARLGTLPVTSAGAAS